MASPTELDLFSRSMAGDRRARTEVYKKYLRDSSRVNRIGQNHGYPIDFLHDCFGNFLRTGHAWDKEGTLASWMESIASWTALQHDRQRDLADRASREQVRMCAEFEGDSGQRGAEPVTYFVGQGAPEIAPAVAILALLPDPERMVFAKRGIEKASWAETATAAGRPLSAVGPLFSRALMRVARLFGAPPPMDDDLQPVFSRAASDPQRADGRTLSLQLDSTFYASTAEMKSAGFGTAYEARALVLWDAATSSAAPPEALAKHLDECHYCTDLLRALILAGRALAPGARPDYLLCPGSFTLATATSGERPEYDEHLKACAACVAEHTGLVRGERSPHANEHEEVSEATEVPTGAGKRIAVICGILIALGLAAFAGKHFWDARGTQEGNKKSSTVAAPLQATVGIDPKYTGLWKEVQYDDSRILSSAMPKNRQMVKWGMDEMRLNEIETVVQQIGPVVDKQPNDAGLHLVYGGALLKQRLMTDAYREITKSEALPPRDAFRCWVMLQFALLVADDNAIDREAGHLAEDPEYGPQVKKLMEEVRKRRG